MNKFKLNSSVLVNRFLKDTLLVRPMLSKEETMPRSVNFTPATKEKLDKLRAKYKLSRSAIIRILIDQIDI